MQAQIPSVRMAAHRSKRQVHDMFYMVSEMEDFFKHNNDFAGDSLDMMNYNGYQEPNRMYYKVDFFPSARQAPVLDYHSTIGTVVPRHSLGNWEDWDIWLSKRVV